MDRMRRSNKPTEAEGQFDANLLLSRYFPRSELPRFFSEEEHGLYQTPANRHCLIGAQHLPSRSPLALARKVPVRDRISLLRRPLQVEDSSRYCRRRRDRKRTPSTIRTRYLHRIPWLEHWTRIEYTRQVTAQDSTSRHQRKGRKGAAGSSTRLAARRDRTLACRSS